MLSRSGPAILLASFAIASAAQQTDFWWSFQSDANSTDPGYDPAFEVCGSSCANCYEGAEQCQSDEFNNICYEPDLGETCCKDLYGTACADGYYCGYNDLNIAYCCEKGTSVQVCGQLFDDTLSRTKNAAVTTTLASATAAFAPTATFESIVARPHRTALPNGGLTAASQNKDDVKKQGLSTAAKIGIAIGTILGVGLIAAALTFFLVHRRHKKKYNAVGSQFGKGGHSGPISAPVPMQSGNAFEPMQHAPEHQQSFVPAPFPPAATAYHMDHPGTRSVSPQPSVLSPFHDNAGVPSRSVSPQPSIMQPYHSPDSFLAHNPSSSVQELPPVEVHELSSHQGGEVHELGHSSPK